MKTPPTPDKAVSREDQIRKRAYELFEQHGTQDGNELDDWLQAEIEVLEAEVKKKDSAA
jgi:hypothetical protein